MKQILSKKPNWQYFTIAYALFAAGFFFLIRPKHHNLFYYLTLLAPYVFLMSRERIGTLLQSSIFRLSIAYLGIVAVSVLWASPPEPHKLSRYLFHFLYLIAFMALTMELVLQNRAFPESVLKAIMASAIIWIPVSIFMFYHEHPWSIRLEGVGRLENPLAGSLMYGMVALLCLHATIMKDSFSTVWRSLAVICGILCLSYMALTQSRSPVIALLMAGLLYAALMHYRKLLLSIFCIAIVAGAAFFLEILPSELIISRGLSYRPEIWKQALPAITENLWFGHSASFDQMYHLPDQPSFRSHTHSALIASLLFVGIVGTGILLMLVVQSFRYAFSAGNHLATCLLSYAIVILSLNGYKLLNHPQIEWLYFWLPVALAAAGELRIKRQDKDTPITRTHCPT